MLKSNVLCCVVCCEISAQYTYRSLGRGLPLTSPNVRQVNGRVHRLRPELDRGVLPGQQVMVRCRDSAKVDDFLNSFFIHSIFVQTLSDMCVLLSPVPRG